MKKSWLVVVGVIMALGPTGFAQQFVTGKIIPEVRCEDASSYSYLLYLPSSYDPERKEKWPVLFVMSPVVGEVKHLQRYLLGAEKNNWIVAMSIQSENANSNARSAILAMVEDVFDRFEVNEKRCYVSGFSGGGREAFWLANEMKRNIIGMIPCGAGDAGNTYDTRALAYGLCGGRCFNRWDMSITFCERIEENGRLRFFPGGHAWAQENLLFDAITWLNAKYLAEKGDKSEIKQFSEMLIAEIEEKREADPFFAYENATVLSELPKAPDVSRAREILSELKNDPQIQLYIQCQEDMMEFVGKHFNTTVGGYRSTPLTSAQEKEAQQMLIKYSTLPIAATIRDFGKASVNP